MDRLTPGLSWQAFRRCTPTIAPTTSKFVACASDCERSTPESLSRQTSLHLASFIHATGSRPIWDLNRVLRGTQIVNFWTIWPDALVSHYPRRSVFMVTCTKVTAAMFAVQLLTYIIYAFCLAGNAYSIVDPETGDILESECVSTDLHTALTKSGLFISEDFDSKTRWG